MPVPEVPTKVKNKELVTRRREQIVLAAIKLFARKGFHETNLRELAEEAQGLADYFRKTMGRTMHGRIVYVSPWAWDEHPDPLRYHGVKASITELTKNLARILATESINANCVVPGFIRDIRSSRTAATGPAEKADQVPLGILGELWTCSRPSLSSYPTNPNISRGRSCG